MLEVLLIDTGERADARRMSPGLPVWNGLDCVASRLLAGGYIYYPDHAIITWPADDLGRGIFYHDRQLNEAFLSVTT